MVVSHKYPLINTLLINTPNKNQRVTTINEKVKQYKLKSYYGKRS